MTNQYRKEVNVKIGGAGVGGCDLILAPGAADLSSCWCLWGTLNYGFCAYTAKIGFNNEDQSSTLNSTQIEDKAGSGRCPKVTGETALCSDVDSLGNCYGKSYDCFIDVSGLCHCKKN